MIECVVRKDGNRFTLRDLGSTNHTFVNRECVRQRRLIDGDIISFGGGARADVGLTLERLITCFQFVFRVGKPPSNRKRKILAWNGFQNESTSSSTTGSRGQSPRGARSTASSGAAASDKAVAVVTPDGAGDHDTTDHLSTGTTVRQVSPASSRLQAKRRQRTVKARGLRGSSLVDRAVKSSSPLSKKPRLVPRSATVGGGESSRALIAPLGKDGHTRESPTRAQLGARAARQQSFVDQLQQAGGVKPLPTAVRSRRAARRSASSTVSAGAKVDNVSKARALLQKALFELDGVDGQAHTGAVQGDESTAAATGRSPPSGRNELIASMSDALCCSICHELIIDAAVLRCSHGFCAVCIAKRWNSGSIYCPDCDGDSLPSTVRAHEVPYHRSSHLDHAVEHLVACLDEEGATRFSARLSEHADAAKALRLQVASGRFGALSPVQGSPQSRSSYASSDESSASAGLDDDQDLDDDKGTGLVYDSVGSMEA